MGLYTPCCWSGVRARSVPHTPAEAPNMSWAAIVFVLFFVVRFEVLWYILILLHDVELPKIIQQIGNFFTVLWIIEYNWSKMKET